MPNSNTEYNIKEVAGISVVWNIISTISTMTYLENNPIKYRLNGLYADLTNVMYGNNAQRKS